MLGPHIFGRGREYLQFTSDEVAEKWYMFLNFCVSCDLKTLVNESTGCRDWQEVFEQDIYYIHEIMNSVTPTQSLDTSSCGSQVGAPPTKHWFCPYNRTTTLGNFGASKIWFDIPNIVNNQVAQGQQ